MPELQLKRNGAVSEKIQLKLVCLIYSLAFFIMSITAFVDYTLCLEAIRINATNIETINVIIPTDIISGFKSYVLGLNLENLTSFKIPGG